MILDPIADMLARMRNAQMRGHQSTSVPCSKLRLEVLNVLKREGYIQGYNKLKNERNLDEIEVSLKYIDGVSVIKHSKRVSKPGRRVYAKIKLLPKVMNGLGISVLSTSKGILSDYEAKKQNVGGELLCTVY